MQAELRILLLCFGLMFVGWIIWDAFRRRKPSSLLKLQKLEASQMTADPLMDSEQSLSTPSTSKAKNKPSSPAIELIAISVMSYTPAGISGDNLHSAIKKCKLSWDPRGLYYRYENNNPSAPLYFTLASATEPGLFDPSTRYFDTTSGILLFMERTDTEGSLMAFEDMISTGRQLATLLACELCNDQHEPLTIETIEQLKASVLQKLHREAA